MRPATRAFFTTLSSFFARLVFPGIVIAVPVGMVFSHRGSAAILASAGLGLLIAYLAAGAPGQGTPLRVFEKPRAYPFFWIAVLFFLAASLSLPGTATPLFHGWRLLEFAAPVAVTAAMLFILRRFVIPARLLWQIMGITLAAAMIWFELENGSPMRAFFRLRVEDWRLNRTVVVLLLMLFPLVAFCLVRFGAMRGAGVAALASILPVVAILNSESGAAVMGLVIGSLTLAAATLFWRTSLALTAFAAVLALLTAPWQGIILWDLIPEALHERLRSTSSAIRVDIWRAFGWAVQDAPFFGSGFNVAAHLEREKAYLAIPEKLRSFIEFGHAHNAALQIWVEFGAFGAALATVLAMMTLRRIDAATPMMRPAMLAAFNTCFAIGVVSHGAWQAWWAGAIGTIIILFFLIGREAQTTRGV